MCRAFAVNVVDPHMVGVERARDLLGIVLVHRAARPLPGRSQFKNNYVAEM